VGSALLVASVAVNGQMDVLRGSRRYSLDVHQYSSCEHVFEHSQTRRSCWTEVVLEEEGNEETIDLEAHSVS